MQSFAISSVWQPTEKLTNSQTDPIHPSLAHIRSHSVKEIKVRLENAVLETIRSKWRPAVGLHQLRLQQPPFTEQCSAVQLSTIATAAAVTSSQLVAFASYFAWHLPSLATCRTDPTFAHLCCPRLLPPPPLPPFLLLPPPLLPARHAAHSVDGRPQPAAPQLVLIHTALLAAHHSHTQPHHLHPLLPSLLSRPLSLLLPSLVPRPLPSPLRP